MLGMGKIPFQEKITLEFFVGSLPSEVNIGHEAQPKVQARVK